MSNTVIKVEGLGKKYFLRHQKQKRYIALRDVIANKIKSLGKKVFNPVSHELTSLNSSVEEFWALKDISLEINQGERLGVIGRNGAGKTTLLKILSRITEPTTGCVSIKGRVASLLEVGTGFHPELTGRENVYLNGAILGMTKAEIKRKFDEIVTFAEVEKFLDTPVKRYSSGMYVRLAFAVAAHLEPEILIVDEVLAVGDAQFQKKCLGKMEDVGKEGRTVLFVSHNMVAVQRLCPRAFLLNNGELNVDGSTRDVIDKYLNIVSGQVAARIDLYDTPRNFGEFGNIRFSKCFILNADGEVKSQLKYGEPLRICFEAIATSAYKDISFVVGVDSVAGVRILTSVSEDFGVVFAALPDAPLRANVLFDTLILTPGLYQLSIAIRSGKRGLDTLMNILTFEVSPQAYANTLPHSGTIGLVSVSAIWQEAKE